MQYFLYILSIPFLYLNYKILYSDIKYKKIPNKMLLFLILLIPFFYIYLFSVNSDINILFFFSKILITIFISFTLYFYWIWSAWDAKYLLVLSLFIPNIWIIPFIWNIWLITLLYLFIYFIYFYIAKVSLNKNYRKSLFENIIISQKDSIKNFFWNSESWKLERKVIFYKIFKAILLFLTIFVIIRLSRIYIIEDAKKYFIWKNSTDFDIKNFISKYSSYLVWSSVILTFLLVYFFRRIYNILFSFFMKYIVKKIWRKLNINISTKDIWFWFLLIIFFLLISFIIYEYIKTWNDVLHKLYLIFTLYLWLYFFFKILFYSYRITFQIAEQDYINITELKSWYIVDKQYLIKLFWTQVCLWFENEDWLLWQNPTIYFQEINNPIDEETEKILKNIYKKVNNYHKINNTPWFWKMKDIKILKTFAFGWYIFIWFLITFFIQDKIFKSIIEIWYIIFQKIYH